MRASVIAFVRSLLVVLAAVLSAVAGAVSQQPVKSHGDSRPPLLKHARILLAQARAEGQKQVSVLIASQAGRNDDVANHIARLGGRLRFRADDVDYLRAIVATDAVEALAAADSVQRVDFDVSNVLYAQQEAPSRRTGQTDGPSVPPPDARTPAINSYLPTHLMGAPQFVAEHPTFDGRGVVIGVIEPGIDPLLPELQEATTPDGRPARKILDVMSTTEPESGDPMWIPLEPVRADVDGRIDWRGGAYRAPKAGPYRIGQLDERQTAQSIYVDDVNDDRNPPGASRVFSVLADPQERVVWVDTNQDGSFADEQPLKNYGERFDVGLLKLAAVGRSPRERVPFAIQLREDASHVRLNLPSSHGTMVTSSAAGKSFFGGAMNGVAPGAQAIVLDPGHLANMGALIEALVLGFRDPRIDLVTCSCGPTPELNDGRSLVLDIIVERLVNHYRKPLTGAAGNAPWMNLVGSPASSDGALGVGGYVDRGTFATNIGIDVPRREYLAAYARGPRDDGGLQPFVVAPTFALAGASTRTPTQKRPYVLPPGYGTGGGTSQATPMAAGALALLISAAKQQSLPYDIDRLRLAVATGARFLPEYGAYEQGNGLIQIEPAWEVLRRLVDAPARISTDAPVNTVMSPLLATPGSGEGLYEREGWRAGMQATREVVLTRTSGPGSVVAYDVRWVGNDGTFESAATVSLPLDRPVAFPVTVRARTPGVHSAILNLMDRKSRAIAHQVLHTIVVAEPLEASNQFTLARSLPLALGELQSVFVDVPQGTNVLHTTVAAAQGRVRLHSVISPSGVHGRRYPRFSDHWPRFTATPGQDAWLTVEDPAPGVWQILVSNVRQSAEDVASAAPVATEARIAIAAYGATLMTSAPGRISVTNHLARFEGGVTSFGLGALEQVELSFAGATSPQVIRDVEVPDGAEQLLVRITTEAAADIDLYAAFCAAPTSCVPMAAGTGLGSDEQILIPKPTPGRWVIIVDPARVPADGARVDYTELLTHPRSGRARFPDVAAERPVGALWTTAAEVERKDAGSGKPLALLAAVTGKDVLAHHQSNGTRQPVGNAIGESSVLETPAVLGDVLIPLRRQDATGSASLSREIHSRMKSMKEE